MMRSRRSKYDLTNYLLNLKAKNYSTKLNFLIICMPVEEFLDRLKNWRASPFEGVRTRSRPCQNPIFYPFEPVGVRNPFETRSERVDDENVFGAEITVRTRFYPFGAVFFRSSL